MSAFLSGLVPLETETEGFEAPGVQSFDVPPLFDSVPWFDKYEGEQRDQQWQVLAKVVPDHVPGDRVTDKEVGRLADVLALARHERALPSHDQPEGHDQDH